MSPDMNAAQHAMAAEELRMLDEDDAYEEMCNAACLVRRTIEHNGYSHTTWDVPGG